MYESVVCYLEAIDAGKGRLEKALKRWSKLRQRWRLEELAITRINYSQCSA
jgi:hypothetical protein